MIASASHSQLVARATAAAFRTPEGQKAEAELLRKREVLHSNGALQDPAQFALWLETARANAIAHEERWNGPLYMAYKEALATIDPATL